MHSSQGLVKTNLPGVEETRSVLDNSVIYCLRSLYEREGGGNCSTATLRAEVEDNLDLGRGFLSVDKVQTC